MTAARPGGWLALIALLFLGACSVTHAVVDESIAVDGATAQQGEDEAEPTVVPAPTSDPSPVPSVTPTPTATPAPVPSPTPVDETPAVVLGDGWVITEQDIDNMVDFIEVTHDLAFTAPVEVLTADDIGAGFARRFEAFSESEWQLMTALGLTEADIDREQANQVRLDRIRGVCCQFDEEAVQVSVELQATKLATEVIVVHELTHALHVQHEELFQRRAIESPDQGPFPGAAAFEGVPQFVAFEYLKLADPTEQALVTPDLPIITDAMVPLTGSGPARFLNFAYDTGPSFVEQVVAERGLAGLSELITSPPTTTEQALFPAKYLEGEDAIDVAAPSLPLGAQVQESASIGAAMLMFVLADDLGQQAARRLVEPWAGDRYVVFTDSGGNQCLMATVVVDSADDASELASALGRSLSNKFEAGSVVSSFAQANEIRIQTCSS